MSKRLIIAAVAAGCLAAGVSTASAQQTSVTYRLYHFEGGSWVEYFPGYPFPAGGDQPGTNLWRYTYELCNYSFSTGVRELNVFFNSDNVLCATFDSAAQPADWSTSQVGPFAPDNNWRARFRTFETAARVAQGSCEENFQVEFTWTCPTLPSSQNFDAVSNSGSDAGVTVPESPVAAERATWSRIKRTMDR